MKDFRVIRKSSKSSEVIELIVSDLQDCTEYMDMMESYHGECLRDGNLLAAKDRDGTILIYEMVRV